MQQFSLFLCSKVKFSKALFCKVNYVTGEGSMPICCSLTVPLSCLVLSSRSSLCALGLAIFDTTENEIKS